MDDISISPAEALKDATEAVRQEYRETSRSERMRSRRVEEVTTLGETGIYRFHVGRGASFDWSWEGSIAYAPLDPNQREELPPDNEMMWKGEVVELDPAKGHLYIAIHGLQFEPTQGVGVFLVRPFPFLHPLHHIYTSPAFEPAHEMLGDRLLTARSGQYSPRLANDTYTGLPELAAVWSRQWGVLWGPPGTGKTYTIGEQVARLLHTSSARILVLSTTNRATDEVALSIGRAMRRHAGQLGISSVLRVGKGGDFNAFEEEGLAAILHGSETDARRRLALLRPRLRAATRLDQRASIRSEMAELTKAIDNGTVEAALDRDRRCVVTTAYNALRLLLSSDAMRLMQRGEAFFNTVILDEAGLLSRALSAALSLHTSDRLVLVGDPRQLAPISRISRVLPPRCATWLQASALAHLSPYVIPPDGVHLLRSQYRMHPDLCKVISKYQYAGELSTAKDAATDSVEADSLLKDAPRAMWYVLDEGASVAEIRAERGPGNKSWIRSRTLTILEHLFASSEALRKGPGLFLSPFVAQAAAVDTWFGAKQFNAWSASTVHSQQGAEARFVIFDTVHAGNHVWPVDEWRRLINVGLSRARSHVILLASRQEMREPYLAPLVALLDPVMLVPSKGTMKWKSVPVTRPAPEPAMPKGDDPSRLGAQIAARNEMTPLLNREQQRLCALRLDGKPRLVRGVAGSGKTVILANWLAKTVYAIRETSEARIWVVYGNASLRALIEAMTEDAWTKLSHQRGFPWEQVDCWHIRDLLLTLQQRLGVHAPDFRFDYEDASKQILNHMANLPIESLCNALFLDEAQDFGHSTLLLLTQIVHRSVESDDNSRSIVVFYDNAQNLYLRGTPIWADFGIDMRGRSTVLKESFRSTKPISEFALNVLYRLSPPDSDSDHRELVRRGLIREEVRNNRTWWSVQFNQIGGPAPIVRSFADTERQIDAATRRLVVLLRGEGVAPKDIKVLYLGKLVADRFLTVANRALEPLGVRAIRQTSEPFSHDRDCVIVTTPHSFKGYDAEVLLIIGADQFWSTTRGVLSAALYVAMTRARSVLEIYVDQVGRTPEQTTLRSTLAACEEDLLGIATPVPEQLEADDFHQLVQLLGESHRSWLERMSQLHVLQMDPVLTASGEILAYPAFTVTIGNQRVAWLDPNRSPKRERYRLEDVGFVVLPAGTSPEPLAARHEIPLTEP